MTIAHIAHRLNEAVVHGLLLDAPTLLEPHHRGFEAECVEKGEDGAWYIKRGFAGCNTRANRRGYPTKELAEAACLRFQDRIN